MKGKKSLFAAVLALVAIAVLLRFGLVVRSVELEGVQHGDAEEVFAVSEISAGESLMRLKEEELRRRINATGIYKLEDVSVHPLGKVKLMLARRKPVAMLSCEGGMALVDEECVLVKTVEEVPAGDMLYLSGLFADGALPGQTVIMQNGLLEVCKSVIRAFSGSGSQGVMSEICFDGEGGWSAISRTGIKIIPEGSGEIPIAWVCTVLQDLQMRGAKGGVLHIFPGRYADYSPPLQIDEASPAL